MDDRGVINDEKNFMYCHYRDGNWQDEESCVYAKSRLIYAEGGIVHVFTKENHWYIPGRCFMWIPAQVEHRVVCHRSTVEMFSLFYSPTPDEEKFYLESNIFLVNDLLREMITHTRKWNGPVNQMEGRKYYFLKAIKAILPEISQKIASYPVQHPYPKNKKLLEIAVYLNANLNESLTLEEVAFKFGLSTRTLSRLFNEHLGMSYIKFLRAIRIAKALELMVENRYSMYEIALQIGYSSLSAFSNIFYRVTGFRPTDFLAKNTLAH